MSEFELNLEEEARLIDEEMKELNQYWNPPAGDYEMMLARMQEGKEDHNGVMIPFIRVHLQIVDADNLEHDRVQRKFSLERGPYRNVRLIEIMNIAEAFNGGVRHRGFMEAIEFLREQATQQVETVINAHLEYKVDKNKKINPRTGRPYENPRYRYSSPATPF